MHFASTPNPGHPRMALRLFRPGRIGAWLGLVGLLLATAVHGEGLPMRLSAAMGSDVIHGRALQELAREIRNASGDKIRPRLFPSAAAGSEAEALKHQLGGNLEAGFTSATVLATTFPAFRLLTLPMLFTTPEEVKNFPETPLGQALTRLGTQDKLVVLGYLSYGYYGILGFRTGTQSLDRMRVRLPFDDWLLRVHRALLLRPVHVPADSLEQAFASGWVQGVVSTPELLSTTPLPTAANQFFKTRHLHGWMVLTANRAWFEGLSAPLREAVSTAAAKVTRASLTQALAREETLLAQWSSLRQPAVVEVAAAPLAQAVAPLALRQARELDPLLGGELVTQGWRAAHPGVAPQDTESGAAGGAPLPGEEGDLPTSPEGAAPTGVDDSSPPPPVEGGVEEEAPSPPPATAR